jgi:hypothetical protein
MALQEIKIHLSYSKRYNYIRVTIDYFNKWVKVIPYRSLNQEAIIKIIIKHIINKSGHL